MTLVRGSHLIVDAPCSQAYLLEVPGERRIFFVLPWKGMTLIGSTEVRQELDEPIECTPVEREYLLSAYHHYFPDGRPVIIDSFAGLRPLIHTSDDANRMTREYAIHREGRLVTVLGGKWTTSLALAGQVVRNITCHPST